MMKASILTAVSALAVSMLPMSAFAWDTPLVNGGVYAIRNELSFKVMDVLNSATHDGAKVIQFDLWNTKNQLWRAAYQSDGSYKFVNINSNKVLEAPGGNRTWGTQLQQWSWNDNDCQKWFLDYTPSMGYYTMHNKMNWLVADAAGYTSNNGAPIIQWELIGYRGESNQRWNFVRAQ